jgi:multisubunit Na+/H+ antiporter MnhF subunit
MSQELSGLKGRLETLDRTETKVLLEIKVRLETLARMAIRGLPEIKDRLVILDLMAIKVQLVIKARQATSAQWALPDLHYLTLVSEIIPFQHILGEDENVRWEK